MPVKPLTSEQIREESLAMVRNLARAGRTPSTEWLLKQSQVVALQEIAAQLAEIKEYVTHPLVTLNTAALVPRDETQVTVNWNSVEQGHPFVCIGTSWVGLVSNGTTVVLAERSVAAYNAVTDYTEYAYRGREENIGDIPYTWVRFWAERVAPPRLREDRA